jgi:hypothetical protein
MKGSLSCQSRQREEESIIQLSSSRPLTAKQAYPIAKARAHKWQTDAYLGRVFMIFPGNEAKNEPRKIIYYFFADHALGPILFK